MRAFAAVAALTTLAIPLAAQQREPIIDVHMHALAASAQGPPPLGMCTPFPEYSAWDPATPYGDVFLAKFKTPACADPIWSPTTDDELMNQTLAIAERRNIIGVLSGPAARVAAWARANPRRFIRGVSFQLSDKDAPSPAALRAMHARGEIQVLGEVTGVLPLSAGDRRRRVHEPRHVRIGSDGLAGNDRARDRRYRRGAVPDETAEARHLLQQRRAVPASQ